MPVPAATEYSIEQKDAFRRLFQSHCNLVIRDYVDLITENELKVNNGRVKRMVYTLTDFNDTNHRRLRRYVQRYFETSMVGYSPISDVKQDDQHLVIYAKSLEEYYVRKLFLLSD